MSEPDAIFADPRLARLYDPLEDDREDLEVYLRMVEEFGARSVLDLGCGTGELAVRLVASGARRGVALSVIGVDPAQASIDVARQKPGSEHVRWVTGIAQDAAGRPRPVRDLDMIVMTGNVAQVFVTDDDWSATLRSCHGMLGPTGRLVFETRDPAQRAWESWSGDGLRSTDHVDGIGDVESWIDVTSVELPLVTFDAWFRFVETGEMLRSTSTLRFRDLDELTSDLESAGFIVSDVRDAPDRPGREFVVIASRTVGTPDDADRRAEVRPDIYAPHVDTADCDLLIDTIRSSVIGADEMVDGPFGPKPVVYADYTASGRSITFIEDYLRDAVLPRYANTHTESSGTGLQTTRFRDDARAIIAECVGARHDEHAVLFCGSGSTGAIDKFVGALGIRVPSTLDDRHHLTESIPADQRPVVFIGPYEHHSNELPWRESIADVVTIDEDADGHVDLDHLRRELERHAERPQLIGSFSAASNVTGILTDIEAVSSLLHEHGALACWDYAAAAPYVGIDMGTPDDGPGYLDAVFISPHKFIGGPGTPGLLVARREVFTNRVPVVPGGGTVSFVNPTEHGFLTDVEHREEGGTPDIIGSIRAGLVFQLKAAVGVEEIKRREERFLSEAIAAWDEHPALEVLGSRDAERLSIVSFVVRDGPERWLHHNFVVAVLNDVFGIQARGGCSCAGPYGHRLLGIDLDRSHEFEREITRGCEGIKPGWVRINFNYFIDDETFEYLVDAVASVADHAAGLLPSYRFEPDSGLWTCRDGVVAPPASLHDISYATGAMHYPDRQQKRPAGGLRAYLDQAHHLLHELSANPPTPPAAPSTNADFEHLRWFRYPTEACAG